MVAKDKLMDVACVLSPYGEVRFTLGDRASVNTAVKELKERNQPEEGDMGGVIMLRMPARRFHMLKKGFDQDGV